MKILTVLLRKWTLFIRLIMSLSFILLSSPLFATESHLEQVKLQLKWFHAFQFAGYYAAKAQGYYADVGLDVEIIERSLDKTVISDVISGQAQYGIESPGLLISYAQGLSIKALAAIFQHTPLVFISKQSSGIIDPQSMRGKRIMMYAGDNGADETPLRALLHDAQISKQDYTHIPQSFNDDDLIFDKTDVIVAYLTDQPFYYRSKGLNINIINPQNYGFDFYGDILFTSQTELEQHPGRAKRFREASLKGWRYALDHTEEIIQLLHTQYKSKSSLEHLRYEAEETRKLISADTIPLGQIKTSRLQWMVRIYQDLQFITGLSETDLENFIYERHINLDLTTEEFEWLENHPVIRLGLNRDFAPHEWIDEQGQYVGHSVDYIRLVEQRLNIKFKLIKDKSWAEIISMAKQGKLDMITDVVNNSERREYLSFTSPYTSNPNIIISDVSNGYIGSLKNLHHKTVALEKSYSTYAFLQQQHPQIKILAVDSTIEALREVHKGNADAYIGDAAVANYAISRSGLLNLRYSGQIEQLRTHSMAIIKSQPLLLSLITKALNSITQEEKNIIDQRWLGLYKSPGIPMETLMTYLVASAVIFLLFLYWIIRLRREISKRQRNEAILKETEFRFTNSQVFAGFGIWDWDLHSDQLYWSETVAPFYGYKVGDIKTHEQLLSQSIHPDDTQKIRNSIQDCMEQSQTYSVEYRVIWPDKSVHWLHEIGNVVKNQQHEPVKMLGTVREISDKKIVEDVLISLAESHAKDEEDIFQLIVRKLATSFQTKYAIIGLLNKQTPGLVETLAVWGNNAPMDNFSYSLKNTPCENVLFCGYQLYPNDIQALFPQDQLAKDLKLSSYVGIPLKDRAENVIGLIALFDTKPFTQHFYTESLLKSLSSRTTIELEQRQTKESLQIANLVYQSIHDAMIMSDNQNNVIAINPAFTKITGYSEQEILYHKKNDKYSSVFYSQIREWMNKGDQWQGEIEYKHKNGQEYIIWMKINSILDDVGKIHRHIALLTDITQQKQAEKSLRQYSEKLKQEVKKQTYQLEQARNQAEQANKVKSDFLANMSHELRTPMHGILSFARFGLKNVETANIEKLAKYFDRINVSAERLLALLNDLLDISKLEAGRMELNMAAYDLYQLVNQCIVEQESWLKERQLKICWHEISENTQAYIDNNRITQVILNLLSNAIKFSDSNKIIYLSIKDTLLKQQPALMFSIQDEGIGIPETELASVFDKFIQSEKHRSSIDGTGLGLPIAKEIISLHDGKIWADNVASGGAILSFIIPRNTPFKLTDRNVQK